MIPEKYSTLIETDLYSKDLFFSFFFGGTNEKSNSRSCVSITQTLSSFERAQKLIFVYLNKTKGTLKNVRSVSDCCGEWVG